MANMTTNLTSTLIDATNTLRTAANGAGAATNSVAPLGGHEAASHSCTVVLLMAAGALLGTIGLVAYQRSAFSSDYPRDRWDWLKILSMAVAAVALVPAFLRTVSSKLLSEAETTLEARLVFVAFCVAAALAARRLIGTLPAKLLSLEKETSQTRQDLERVAEVVANRTATHRDEPRNDQEPADERREQPEPPQPEPAHQGIQVGPGPGVRPRQAVAGYDVNELSVIRALLNPRYPQGRSVTGLAFDTGLTVPQVQNYLAHLQADGLAAVFGANPNRGPLWHLTNQGRALFANRDLPPADADVGIQ
jgi:hypothetical protein